MTTISEFLQDVGRRIPWGATAEWDVGGLQLGDPAAPLHRVAVCHEVTETVVAAVETDPPDLLLSYHPLLFTPTRVLVAGRSPSGRAIRLIRAGVALAIAHTAFDVAPGGSADALAEALGMTAVEAFGPVSPPYPDLGLGRVGAIGPGFTLERLADLVTQVLGVERSQVSGPDVLLSRVAVIPGSGSSMIPAAVEAGAEVLVTGDVTHHRVVEALDGGVSIIDPGHAATERPGMRRLAMLVGEMAETIDLTELDPTPWR